MQRCDLHSDGHQHVRKRNNLVMYVEFQNTVSDQSYLNACFAVETIITVNIIF